MQKLAITLEAYNALLASDGLEIVDDSELSIGLIFADTGETIKAIGTDGSEQGKLEAAKQLMQNVNIYIEESKAEYKRFEQAKLALTHLEREADSLLSKLAEVHFKKAQYSAVVMNHEDKDLALQPENIARMNLQTVNEDLEALVEQLIENN